MQQTILSDMFIEGLSKDDIVIITGGFPQNKDTNFMKIEKI